MQQLDIVLRNPACAHVLKVATERNHHRRRRCFNNTRVRCSPSWLIVKLWEQLLESDGVLVRTFHPEENRENSPQNGLIPFRLFATCGCVV